MSERKGFSKLVVVLVMVCIVLVGALAAVLINYVQTVRSNDSQMSRLNLQIETLLNQTTQLQSWLDGNVSVLNTIMNITRYANGTQAEPPWKVQFFKGFQISWPQRNWLVSTPEWELYSGGYSKAIIYMRLTNISPSLNGISTTFFLNYIEWYGSQEGGNDFVGTTILSENNLSVTMPGPVDPQSGPLEVETKAPYFTFQFAVDTTYNGSAWATFDMSVYFRN
jgi:hypothetical protein